METGQSKADIFPPEPFTFLKRDGDKDQVQSVGLIFGPDFFTWYGYGDRQGHNTVGFSSLPANAPPPPHVHEALREPLYALNYAPAWTLVPRAVFDEQDAWEYLRFNTSATDPQRVAFDTMPLLDAVLVYQTEPTAEAVAAELNPGMQLRHAVSVFLELMKRAADDASDEPFLWLHGFGDHSLLAAMQDNTLTFANSVHVNHVEDLRYFVHYTARQLGILDQPLLYTSGHSRFSDRLNPLFAKHFRLSTAPPTPAKSSIWDADSLIAARHYLGLYAPICAS